MREWAEQFPPGPAKPGPFWSDTYEYRQARSDARRFNAGDMELPPAGKYSPRPGFRAGLSHLLEWHHWPRWWEWPGPGTGDYCCYRCGDLWLRRWMDNKPR